MDQNENKTYICLPLCAAIIATMTAPTVLVAVLDLNDFAEK